MFFSDAWLFWILVPAYVVWTALWLLVSSNFKNKSNRKSVSVRFPSLTLFRQLKPSQTLWMRRVIQGLRLVVLGLLVLAMARPQTGRTHTRVHTEGVDIMLVLDTSGTMRALDLDAHFNIAKRRHRLNVVKDVVQQFVQQRPNDQIGVVVFGEQAFTQCPLTLDHGIVATFLQRIEIGMAGDRTAIGSALATAVKRLKKSKTQSKIVVLLTDGRNNAGSITPKTAAELAKTFDIKVYIIGAGTRGKAPFLVEHPIFGKQVQYQDVSIDEALLKEMATMTGGQYFRAEDADALEKIYEHIDELERTKIEMSSYQEYNERFSVFVLSALALLLFEIWLLGTRFKKLP